VVGHTRTNLTAGFRASPNSRNLKVFSLKTVPFGSVPYWFRKIVGEYNLIPRGFSKYTAALELYEFKSRSLTSKTLPRLGTQ
jgi:hypothetical protein